MIIKEVSLNDSEDIFKWRNNLDTRLMAKNSKEIKKPIHDEWFKEKIVDDNCFFYLGINQKVKIGVVRFDCDAKNKKSEVSINMNPAERGKKISAFFLQKCIDKFLQINKYSLYSTIKKNNYASQKIFLKCNFKFFKSNKSYDFYILKVE